MAVGAGRASSCAPRPGLSLCPLDVDPTSFLRASRDGLAYEHLVVAIDKRRVAFAGLAGSHGPVDGRVQRSEGVRETFDVPARQERGPASFRVHQRRVARQQLVRSASVTDPKLVGRLRGPRRRGLGAIELNAYGVLPARTRLG